jgi:hypothetical protein
MCAVEQNEAIVMPETKKELVMNIMNIDEINGIRRIPNGP